MAALAYAAVVLVNSFIDSDRACSRIGACLYEMSLMLRPRTLERIRKMVWFLPDDSEHPTNGQIDSALPDADFVIGQTDLPRARLERATRLKAIFNVESNFLPNIDYEYCFSRGIHVLTVSPVFAQSVAELGLGLAIDLARSITHSDQAFRARKEVYGLESNGGAYLLSGQTFGIIGYGDLGRALHVLLRPFGGSVSVYDPWVPAAEVAAAGAASVSLEMCLRTAKICFVTASVTSENQGFLGQGHFDLLPDGASFVLLSRAGVVDFNVLTTEAQRGRIRIATDVFPEEPLPSDHPIRSAPHAVLSAHRAGAMVEAFYEMGELVTDDVELMLRDLPHRVHGCITNPPHLGVQLGRHGFHYFRIGRIRIDVDQFQRVLPQVKELPLGFIGTGIRAILAAVLVVPVDQFVVVCANAVVRVCVVTVVLVHPVPVIGEVGPVFRSLTG